MLRAHAACIFMLLLSLKRFRLPWIILVLTSALSNLFLFSITDKWAGTAGKTLVEMCSDNLLSSSEILMDIDAYPKSAKAIAETLTQNENGSPGAVEQFFQYCNSRAACSARAFKLLYGRGTSNTYTAYIDYDNTDNRLPSVICQTASGEELSCPFIGHLVAASHNWTLYQSGHAIGRFQVFRLTARSGRDIINKAAETSSMCSSHENLDTVLSRTLVIQTILFTCSAFFYLIIGTLNCIVYLKENYFLKMMFQKGLSLKAFWIATWSITTLEVLLPAVFLLFSHAVQCPGFYKASSMIAVVSGAVLHLFGIAALGFLMTILVQKLFHMALTLVIVAICSCVVSIIIHLHPSTPDWLKIVLLFLVPLGHLGEFMRAHLLTATLPDSVTTYHHLVLVVSVLFPIATVALTFYLDFILKNGNGFCLKPNYILDKRFWEMVTNKEIAPAKDPLTDETLPETANVEPMTEGFKPIVRIHQVTKQYITGSSCLSRGDHAELALSGLSAHIYEGQITAFIGHNRSGKTTLLNILNGTESPTSGQVSVDGMLVNDPMNRMRLQKIIGICPQENALSSALTVMQTLEMATVSCSRGVKDPRISLPFLLRALCLEDKLGHRIKHINNVTRRKLCTAIALIGDSKLLFLDEPTNGVDPVTRRRMWKLFREYKKTCSIILSTQAMDEADTLADRMIFLSGGALICAGSSMFLKSAFDCGINFNVTLKAQTFAPLLTRVIQDELPTVQVKGDFNENLQFHLPALQIGKVPLLVQTLERRMEWISAFGILQASLCDVFMRLRDLSPTEVEDLFKQDRIGLLTRDELALRDAGISKKMHTLLKSTEMVLSRSRCCDFSAMAGMNITRVMRSRVKLCSRILAPLVLLLIFLVMAFVERAGNKLHLSLHRNLTNFGDGFRRGVCVFHSGSNRTLLTGTICATVLTGKPANGEHFLAIELPDGVDLTTHLKAAAQIEHIRSVCQGHRMHSTEASATTSVECPIVYADVWSKLTQNKDRFVSVGSFSLLEAMNTSFAASVNIGAYYRLLRYFLAEDIARGRIQESAFKTTVMSVYEFRSTFIPLFGVFFQIVIIAILPATFLDDLLEDKETMVRNQLSSMGMSTINYWITMHFVHWVQYALIYLISVVFLVSINPTGYASAFYLAGIVLPTLVLGLSNNQLTVYILSSLLNKSNPIVTVAYFFHSIILFVILVTVQQDNVTGIVMIVLVPPIASIALTFYGTRAIFYTLSFFNVNRLSAAGSFITEIYFTQPHILCSLLAMVLHSVVLLVILGVLESQIIQQLFHGPKKTTPDANDIGNDVDAGISDEFKRLDEIQRRPENLLECHRLRMTFPNGTKAVRNATYAISPGEIFGLLGPNGAGKSTTLAIIVGDLRATGGRCEVQCGNQWLSSGLVSTNGYIGYCPQYNPHYADVTLREHMEFFAKILGLSDFDAGGQIDAVLEGLDLDDHETKLSSELSYGCKRRLSLAVALLGDPCLLVIDEASTGVDTEGKRFIWKAIRAVASQRRAIVVTTHSMEEAEALCSRVSVMNNGLLVALGTVQQLKSRYGECYTLEILLATQHNEPAESLKHRRLIIFAAVAHKFRNATTVEEFSNRIILSIPLSSTSRLSSTLSWLAEIKESYGIMYFSFYQMSLDQVFTRIITQHNNRINKGRESNIFAVPTKFSIEDLTLAGSVEPSPA